MTITEGHKVVASCKHCACPF